MFSMFDPTSAESFALPPSPVDSLASSECSPIETDISKIPFIGTAARCRTAVACDKCRERKTKCSGEKPVCKRCASRGLNCVYASRDTKRRGHSNAPASSMPSRTNRRGSYGAGQDKSSPYSSAFYENQLSSSQYPNDDLQSRIRHAYPTACPPSVGLYAQDRMPPSNLSYYPPRSAPAAYPIHMSSSRSSVQSLLEDDLRFSNDGPRFRYSPVSTEAMQSLYATTEAESYDQQYGQEITYYSTVSPLDSLDTPPSVDSQYHHFPDNSIRPNTCLTRPSTGDSEYWQRDPSQSLHYDQSSLQSGSILLEPLRTVPFRA